MMATLRECLVNAYVTWKKMSGHVPLVFDSLAQILTIDKTVAATGITVMTPISNARAALRDAP